MASIPALLAERIQAVSVLDPELRPATRPQFGHYQSNVALRLAALAKDGADEAGERPEWVAAGMAPRQIAEALVERVDLSDLTEPLEVAGPGFINIRVRSSVLATVVTEQLADIHAGIAQTSEPARVVVDYSAPNVAKPMHVGNLRSTIIGDCLVRVLRAVGDTVIPQNHIGDWGTQFGMLVEQILFEGIDASTLTLATSVELYQRAQQHFRSDEAFAEAARRRVVALQSGDEQTRAIWKSLIDVSKAGFNAAYARLGVLLTDDDLAGESIYNDALPKVATDLEAAGIAVIDQGALCVFIPGDDAPLIIRKSDGGYGYAATDLAAIRHRVDDLAARRLVYVVGSPQAHHFHQVFAVARMAGWLPDGVSAEHVGFGSVLGPDGKMFKTRDGKAVTLDTLLDAAEEVAAPDIAMAAVKYADLSNALHKDYVFDIDRMVATTGDTGPYLQYAHARVNQILRKAAAEGDVVDDATATITVLAEPAEQELALLLTRFSDTVAEVADGLQPHKLCGYLFEVATTLSSFYEKCPVLKAEGEVRRSRLVLCRATQRVLATGLDLLGIVAPERM
ncbi:MAG: arginine--tRNA ligase [Propionibacteriaceae bacterium]|jgi:arginyl-tRNA synthetase|nr:arginine--tRNA ligase [Propionibacteriaceae bacterium]